MPPAAPMAIPSTSRMSRRMRAFRKMRARKHTGLPWRGRAALEWNQLPGAAGVPPNKDITSQTDRHTVSEQARHEAGEFKPRLIVVSGMLLGQQLELGGEPIVIGRGSECALSMPHPSVSRLHC